MQSPTPDNTAAMPTPPQTYSSAAAGFKTNLLSRFPKLPKKEKPTDGASDFR